MDLSGCWGMLRFVCGPRSTLRGSADAHACGLRDGLGSSCAAGRAPFSRIVSESSDASTRSGASREDAESDSADDHGSHSERSTVSTMSPQSCDWVLKHSGMSHVGVQWQRDGDGSSSDGFIGAHQPKLNELLCEIDDGQDARGKVVNIPGRMQHASAAAFVPCTWCGGTGEMSVARNQEARKTEADPSAQNGNQLRAVGNENDAAFEAAGNAAFLWIEMCLLVACLAVTVLQG